MSLPPNWTKYETDDGRDYYHNDVTNVTQWDPPSPAAKDVTDVYEPKFEELQIESSEPIIQNTAEAKVALGADEPIKESTRLAPSTAIESNDVDVPLHAGKFSWAPCLDVSVMQSYFDVNSADVAKRLKQIFVPSNSSDPDFANNPDYYGPMWIATTAVIFMAATGNFALLIDGTPHMTDFTLASVAAGIVYGMLVFVPAATYALLYFTGQPVMETIDFKHFICVYGYSLAPLVPVSCLCLIPNGIARWVFCGIGLALSMAFLWTHFLKEVCAKVPKIKVFLLVLLSLANATLFLLFRIYFLTDHTGAAAPITSTPVAAGGPATPSMISEAAKPALSLPVGAAGGKTI